MTNALDRQGLISYVDRYFDALVAKDPLRLPLSPKVRFTENCQTLALGKGLWATVEGRGPYRLNFADPTSGQAGCFATVEEMGNLAVLMLRLKVEDQRIGEIETLVARFGLPITHFNPGALKEPNPILLERVPEAERSPRDELAVITNSYFDALERSDGTIVPIHPDCIRLENGVQTTSNPNRAGIGRLPVAEGLSSGFYKYISGIRDRRFPILDEEYGLSFAIVFFEHPGNIRSVDVPAFGALKMAPFALKPSSAMIAELFKIRNGQIHHIEAVLEFLPYGIRSGWE